MPDPAIRRKPVRSMADVCLCDHHLDDHGAGGACERCECRKYQARPCRCGHAAHRGDRCTDRECRCRQYVADATPAFLLRLGVRAGQWKFESIDRLRALMRPATQDPAIRVYACGLLHTLNGGKGTRLATKRDKSGRDVPLRATDIADELNELDTLGRMDKTRVGKLLHVLEERGLARKGGKPRKGERLLYFYAKPLTSRVVAPDPDLGVCADPQTSVTDSETNQLLDALILTLRSGLVKTFRKAARPLLEGHDSDEVLEQAVREAEARLMAAAEQELKQLGAALTPTAAAPIPASGPQLVSDPEHHPLAGIRECFPGKVIEDEALVSLDTRLAAELGDYNRSAFVAFVREKVAKRRCGPGLVFSDKGFAREFILRELGDRGAEKQRAEAAETRRRIQEAFAARLADERAVEEERDRWVAERIATLPADELAAYEARAQARIKAEGRWHKILPDVRDEEVRRYVGREIAEEYPGGSDGE